MLIAQISVEVGQAVTSLDGYPSPLIETDEDGFGLMIVKDPPLAERYISPPLLF